MPTITKSVRITLDDAVWQALHQWTDIMRRDAKELGIKEGVREEAVIAAILSQTVCDNLEELRRRRSERVIKHIESKGFLGPVCAQTARAALGLDATGTDDR